MRSAVNTAVVIGTVGVDLLADSRRSPLARASVGNSAANIAIRLASADWAVQFVCLVGADPLGEFVMADLERFDVGTAGVVRRPGYATPRIFQVLDSASGAGDGGLLFDCPRCGRPRGYALEAPDVAEIPAEVLRAAQDARLVISDMTGVAAELLFDSSRDGLRWFEASLREAPDDEIAELAALADVAKVSSDDVGHYRAALTSPAVRPWLRLVTRGGAGVDVQSKHARGWSEWETVPTSLRQSPVDPIGAGDAFTANAAAVLAAEAPHEDGDADASLLDLAVRAGQDAAAIACLSRGALGDLPTVARPEVLVEFECARCYAEATASDNRRRG